MYVYTFLAYSLSNAWYIVPVSNKRDNEKSDVRDISNFVKL